MPILPIELRNAIAEWAEQNESTGLGGAAQLKHGRKRLRGLPVNLKCDATVPAVFLHGG